MYTQLYNNSCSVKYHTSIYIRVNILVLTEFGLHLSYYKDTEKYHVSLQCIALVQYHVTDERYFYVIEFLYSPAPVAKLSNGILASRAMQYGKLSSYVVQIH